MQDKPQRRELKFSDLDDVVRDVENLREKGYYKAGTWDLAQVCGHVNDFVVYALDGYPRSGIIIGSLLTLIRVTAGKRILRRTLQAGSMPAGKPTMPQSVHPPGENVDAAVNKLKETVHRFKNHQGELHSSPVFGRLSTDECKRLNLIHAAHHLSFLIPKAA